MRLSTFEINNKERWGIVIAHPTAEEDWVFTPDECEDYIASINNPEAQELLKKLKRLNSNSESAQQQHKLLDIKNLSHSSEEKLQNRTLSRKRNNELVN